MDIKLFFNAVPEEVLEDDLPNSSFQKSIFINHEVMYDLEGIKIALISVPEYRGAGLTERDNEGTHLFRRFLYRLSRNAGNGRILDLGEMRPGPTAQDTQLRLAEVVEYLLNKEVLPVIVGGSHDLDLGQYRGYQSLGKLLTWLAVDSRFDLDEKNENANSHLAKIIKYDPNYLFNYVHLGYQSYFVYPEDLRLMDNLYFEPYRLGDIKGKLDEIEPVVRDADALSFDLSSIQSHYCPGVISPNVFGLTGEEACQICWYAGLNDKLSSVGFYSYLPSEDDSHHTTASVLATMIWYFIEGYFNRKGDINFLNNDYTIFEVPLKGNPESIRFFKSNMSEKWWVEIPDENGVKSVFLRNKMVPCSYADYEKAVAGEIPQRYMSAFAKINT